MTQTLVTAGFTVIKPNGKARRLNLADVPSKKLNELQAGIEEHTHLTKPSIKLILDWCTSFTSPRSWRFAKLYVWLRRFPWKGTHDFDVVLVWPPR